MALTKSNMKTKIRGKRKRLQSTKHCGATLWEAFYGNMDDVSGTMIDKFVYEKLEIRLGNSKINDQTCAPCALKK